MTNDQLETKELVKHIGIRTIVILALGFALSFLIALFA